MTLPVRRSLPLLCILLLLVLGLVVFLRPPAIDEAPTPEPLPTEEPQLSSLASAPDWSELDAMQNRVSAETFEELLRSIYALPNSWEDYFTILSEADGIEIQKSYQRDDRYRLQTAFASAEPPAPLPPLDQIHIAIDPGHIGGDFAELEQRSFDPTPGDDSDLPVREGDLSLATARHLQPLLEELGARVTLVRETAEPVTESQPEDFMAEFGDRVLANQIFYRTAEIRARADLLNEVIQPDLILCLHYNAEGWSDPAEPWSAKNHFHIILNGAYMAGEVANEDQRFEMVRNLLARSTERALPLAQTISDVFLRETALSPFAYSAEAPAMRLDPERPIFARNLLANRLYVAPTIFLEPYIMNNREVFARVQLGDYEGLQEVDGIPRRSLVREYAEVLAQGIVEFYQK